MSRLAVSIPTLAFIALFVCLAGCERRMMATPLVYCNGSDPATCFDRVPEALRGDRIDVLYVTDRARVNTPEVPEGETRYGAERSYGMAFGSAVVHMGNVDRDWNEIVSQSVLRGTASRISLHVDRVVEQGRFPETPLAVDIPNADADADADARLRQEITRRLKLSEQPALYIYVHGFNNDFNDSVMAIAETWHFLGRGGVPIAYTWPSRRETSLLGYAYDRESGEFTVYHLKQFLRIASSCEGVEKVHLIAHSRGSDVTLSALRELFIEARAAGRDPREVYRIGNLVLAAPDMDVDVAMQRFATERIDLGAERVTMYVSEHDKALGITSWLFSSVERLGRIGLGDLLPGEDSRPITLPRVDTIDVQAQLGFLGHMYFTNSPEVSSDVVLLLRDNRAPGASNGRPLVHVADNIWQLPDGYPDTQPSQLAE